jgi:hypothetical protein
VNPLTDWPAPDEERRFLVELAADTPTAQGALAELYFPLLMRFLARKFPRVEAHLREEAAGQAVLDFVRPPRRYDPTRARLGAYLRVAARNDLLNLLARERRARRGIPLDSVAEPTDHRNTLRDDELGWNDPRLTAEIAAFDTHERAAFDLMLEDVHDTAAFADRLNLGNLPAEEWASAVKRVKDRVKKRLVRAVEDSK